MLDFSCPSTIGIVKDKGTAQALTILAEEALFVFRGFPVLNDISRMAIRALNSNPDSHRLSSNGSTYSSIG
jgi:hypothetical protein